MSNNGIPVIKFLFKEDFKALNDALKSQPSYEVEDYSSPSDLATFLSTSIAGLVIASLRDRDDLIQIATFLKIVKVTAKDTPFKVVVINFSNDKNFEKAIAKLGIQDTVEPTTNVKGFKFKLDFWMKSINAHIKTSTNTNSKNDVKNVDQTKAPDKKLENQTPIWENPLDLEDDIWIIKNESDCKKVLTKWLIRLLGPSPYVGQWVKTGAGHWRFDIKENEKELYISGSGSWFFVGEQKPDFVWKENIWLVTGENFELYYKTGVDHFSRFKSKNRNISICKNSIYARTKEPIIIESFNKELVFKREAEQLENLDGKSKTDRIDGGPLSGKNSGSSDLGGNLTGKTEGEQSTKEKDLSHKNQTSKTSSFWDGKNSNEDKKSGDDSSAKMNDPLRGVDLERERSDLEHQKYYKNHNEAQKYDTPEAKEKQFHAKEEKGSGSLSGKSTTEHLERNYDNSKDRSKNETEKKDEEMSGKSGTDHLKSHMGQKSSEEYQAADKKAGARGNPTPGELAEKQRKEKEEILNKERSENLAKNKADAAIKDKKANEGIEQLQSRKQKDSKSEEINKTKTALEKNFEAEHDYEMAGQEKINSLLAKKKAERDNKKDGVLPFLKKEEDPKRPLTAEEKELEEITRDASMSVVLKQNGKKITCLLDDYFDETIIFKTNDAQIQVSRNVQLDLVFKFLEKNSKVSMEGNVLSVDNDEDGGYFVTVQLSQENALSLEKIMRLYEIRQGNINVFFEKVKGA